MPRINVTVYEVTKQFGGYEEGGWYYPVTEYQYAERCKSNKKAKALAEKLKEEFKEEYDGIDYRYVRFEKLKDIGKEDDTDKPRPRYE